jgi:hypothetical protein
MDTKTQQPARISLKDTTEIVCSCGHNYFKEVVNLRKISALLSGTGKEEFIPVAVLVCEKCSKPFDKSPIIT